MKLKSIITIFLGCITFTYGNAQVEIPKNVNELFVKHTCFTCHKPGAKLVGPSWEDISAKGLTKDELVASIKSPNLSRWPGYPPMMPMPHVPQKDLEKMAEWLIKIGVKKKSI